MALFWTMVMKRVIVWKIWSGVWHLWIWHDALKCIMSHISSKKQFLQSLHDSSTSALILPIQVPSQWGSARKSPSPTSLQLCACISIVVKGNPDCTNLLICSVSFSFSSEVNKSWIILPPDGWQKGHHSSYIIIKAFCISVMFHNQILFPEWL